MDYNCRARVFPALLKEAIRGQLDRRFGGFPQTGRQAGSGNIGPPGDASLGRPAPRDAIPPEEMMGGDPLESLEARTAVGPTGLEGATGGGSPTVHRSGGALGRPWRGGPGAQQ